MEGEAWCHCIKQAEVTEVPHLTQEDDATETRPAQKEPLTKGLRIQQAVCMLAIAAAEDIKKED
ncbi:hypothetical protein AnigIFM63309_010972 [Aspergillus niger]|nr:hypothetical protein AnigIFM63309_010972 [Aspergillus niger]